MSGNGVKAGNDLFRPLIFDAAITLLISSVAIGSSAYDRKALAAHNILALSQLLILWLLEN